MIRWAGETFVAKLAEHLERNMREAGGRLLAAVRAACPASTGTLRDSHVADTTALPGGEIIETVVGTDAACAPLVQLGTNNPRDPVDPYMERALQSAEDALAGDILKGCDDGGG